MPESTVAYFAYRDDLAKPGGCDVVASRPAELMGYQLAFVEPGDLTLQVIRGDGTVSGLLFTVPASCVASAQGGAGYLLKDVFLEPSGEGGNVPAKAWMAEAPEAAPAPERVKALLAARARAKLDSWVVLAAVPAAVELPGKDGIEHAMMADPAAVSVVVTLRPSDPAPALRSVEVFATNVPREPDAVWADGTPVSRGLVVEPSEIWSALWLLHHDGFFGPSLAWWVSSDGSAHGGLPAGALAAPPPDPPSPYVRVELRVQKGGWHHQLAATWRWDRAGRESLTRLANSFGATSGDAVRSLAAQLPAE